MSDRTGQSLFKTTTITNPGSSLRVNQLQLVFLQVSRITVWCATFVACTSRECDGNVSSATTMTFAPSATCLGSTNWITSLTVWIHPGRQVTYKCMLQHHMPWCLCVCRLRVRVPTRVSSKKKEARGIYQHAKVIPGRDWVAPHGDKGTCEYTIVFWPAISLLHVLRGYNGSVESWLLLVSLYSMMSRLFQN